jgi:hypothetical protein
VRAQAKSGDPKLKTEVADLERVLAHLEAERPLRDWAEALPPGLEPLTAKPVIVVENGPGGIDAKLEDELADLPEDEAADFREGPSALNEIARRLFEALDLIMFFTANENEARGWTLRRGRTALDAAGAIHTDIAHGFVRCEVIPWDDLVECGSRAEAARRGLQRLEGKAALGQASRRLLDLLRRVDADAEVRERSPVGLLERERDRRIRQLELRVAGFPLRRLRPEELAVERDRAIEVGNVEREVECVHVWLPSSKTVDTSDGSCYIDVCQ